MKLEILQTVNGSAAAVEDGIIIRPAEREDAGDIARAVLMALHDELAMNFAGTSERIPLVLELFHRLASMEDSQYSYRNALVAQVPDGRVAGVLVAYDGARLHALRERFVTEANAVLDAGLDNSAMDDETTADEFYLDSLAVFPEFRGHRLGGRLIEACCGLHADSGKPFGLLCEPGYDHLYRLYTSLGFEDKGLRLFAGKSMHHLQRKPDCQ